MEHAFILCMTYDEGALILPTVNYTHHLRAFFCNYQSDSSCAIYYIAIALQLFLGAASLVRGHLKL